jgi:CheY-like chemotaxis protein
MSKSETQQLRGLRLLVVDDDADNREMLALTLEQCGARVATAGSAAEAMRILEEEERPQVLISDIGLPDEDGFSLMRKIRARSVSRGGDIPAIALTGHGGEEDRAQTRGAGFNAHLTKPVAPEEMLEAILRILQPHLSS